MAQVYKMMLGTSGKQWEQLTVREDGTMMLYFHGTDRSVTQQVTAIEDGEWKGWLKSEKGSMWPGLASGRWTLVSAAEQPAEEEQRTTTDDVKVAADNTDCTDEEHTGIVPAVSSDDEVARITEGLSPACLEKQTVQMQAPCAERFAREEKAAIVACEVIPQPMPTPRPRRQRKPRKSAAAVAPVRRYNVTTESRYNDAAEPKTDNGWLRSAGYLAAASVALLVIWQTGLIIPLGLIGLATSGLLK